MVKKVELTFIELKRLMKEISEQIVGSRIENIYDMHDGSVILKLLKKDEKYELRIVPSRCIYLVKGEYKKPQTPSDQILRFRKLLNNSIIKKVELVEGERIIFFNVEKRHGEVFNLIVELLPKGTVIITDSSGRILECLKKLVMTGRKIIVGEEYKLPPRRPTITSSTDIEQLLKSIDKNRKIVSGLAVDAGLGGRYAEEVIYLAGIDKSKKFSELSIKEYENIKESIIKVLEYVELGTPVVIESATETYPLPYLLKSLKINDIKINEVSDFNEAVRVAYEKNLLRQITRKASEKIEEEIKQLNKELEDRYKTLEKLTKLSEVKSELAKIILTHSSEIEELKHLATAEEKDLGGVKIRVDSGLGAILISSQIGEVQLNFNESIVRQASRLFDESKKISSRIEEIKKEINDIYEKINRLSQKKQSTILEELQDISPKLTLTKKNWYEKYRWFYTSEGFLAVAGKDASSNNALIRKHLEKDDLVFHSEVRGAPILILKNGVNSSEKSIIEAAQFAACYSRAWREGLQYVSVYYVKPEQVSLSPPPGHYLPKGGVIIKGERKYLNVKLELAIGVEDDKLAWGPSQTLEGRTIKMVKIIPGDKKARKLAEEIVNRIFKEADTKKKTELIEKIVQVIPYGCGSIS